MSDDLSARPQRAAEPSTSLPYPGAPFIAAMRRFFQNYAIFRGRSSRAEFWWPVLMLVAFPWLVQIVNGATTGDWRIIDTRAVQGAPEVIVLVFSLVTFLPTLAVTWRRLHDTNRSGLWIALVVLPIIGWIALAILLALPGERGGARFDPRS